ncbi:MAG: glycoside hydrolase family 65 protein, partial [bacterium]|nr:glycoside hydrolase family 65 protein [bacterium]
VCTSRDRAPGTVARVLAGAARVTFDGLLAEHAAAWERRWRTADVVIEGDPRAQHALRVNLYHLLRALPRGDARVAICAKGYAGELYQGLFFWDTEMFMLPFYLYTDPGAARTLADFRVQALPGAQRVAAHYKYAGARYPWTSDDHGDECCGPWVFKDHQVHVTADVVYGLVHYARATNTPGYLRGAAARVLLETARYWMQRIDHRAGDPRPHLLGVMGPDEFTPMTSNNSYTNRLVAFALTAAAAVGRAAGAAPAECRAFARTAAALPLPRAQDGTLVLQCEEFEGLADMNIKAVWKNRRIMFCWQVPQERMFRSKCMKQADVLLLMALFPHEFTAKEMRRAWNYYLPLTTHDSSLSFGTHCILAAWLGLAAQAYAFWRRSAELDLDVRKGSAAEGIHIAAAGNTWQAAIFGFAGVATALQADVLTITPHLPRRWHRLAFPLVWHDTPVDIDITRASVAVTNKGIAPLAVNICATRKIIAPGHSLRVPR